MARNMSVFVVFLVASVVTATKATDCMSVGSSIMPCSNFLRDPKMTAPGSFCCNAAANLLGLGDVDSLCKCLHPFSSGFLTSKAQMLPAICNLPRFSPLVSCLAPSTDMPETPLGTPLPPLGSPLPPVGSPLPPFPQTPVFPLPPVFPFPPFPQTPVFPFPPFPQTPVFPFPPFPLTPVFPFPPFPQTPVFPFPSFTPPSPPPPPPPPQA